MYEGQLLCKRHYKPVARELEEQKKFQKARKRQARQRLVVRYKDGTLEKGVSFAINPKEGGFHLDRVDDRGVTTDESIHVNFTDVKAVFYVKRFEGLKRGAAHSQDDHHHHQHRNDPTFEGSEVVVVFFDGEVIEGHTMHAYNPEERRFFLIPEDEDTNNVTILVEQSAVSGVYTPTEYEAKLAADKEARRRKAKESNSSLSQEETMGDFYFETRNYSAALEQYLIAQRSNPESSRLQKKVVLSKFNIGVQHIKRRDYPKALEFMEEVLKFSPNNASALKKADQLRKIIKKEKKRKADQDKHPTRP